MDLDNRSFEEKLMHDILIEVTCQLQNLEDNGEICYTKQADLKNDAYGLSSEIHEEIMQEKYEMIYLKVMDKLKEKYGEDRVDFDI